MASNTVVLGPQSLPEQRLQNWRASSYQSEDCRRALRSVASRPRPIESFLFQKQWTIASIRWEGARIVSGRSSLEDELNICSSFGLQNPSRHTDINAISDNQYLYQDCIATKSALILLGHVTRDEEPGLIPLPDQSNAPLQLTPREQPYEGMGFLTLNATSGAISLTSKLQRHRRKMTPEEKLAYRDRRLMRACDMCRRRRRRVRNLFCSLPEALRLTVPVHS